MTLYDKITYLDRKTGDQYYPQRTMAQLNYASKLSFYENKKYDGELDKIADFLIAECEKEGVITATAAKKAEEMLAFMEAEAKKITVHCVSHAHIDMNWMWGFQETTAAAVDTFRTILDLMNEYKGFTYSQSQASVYKIIAEHDPEMLQEIKERIREGRWEVTATTWVEPDKIMPNGESMARHILYTKRYLTELLDLKPTDFELDFEPDTFAHTWTVPEILNRGGVKYYYHCRANDRAYAYRWQSRSGATVLAYREPKWYNALIEYDMFYDVPQYCHQNGVNVMMKVYGIGNHGGGPTRKDIERLSDMMTWKVMPKMVFSRYHDFFHQLEKFADKLPIINSELNDHNTIFSGCQTTQTRIKMANRMSEDRLYESEAISAASALLSKKPQTKSYEEAWQRVLFNHFHDIIPGSGVIDTREYAMGEFQKVMATSQTNMTNSLRAITKNIDTSMIDIECDRYSESEGGGVGFAVDHGSGYRFPQTERGSGKVRIFHLFNPTAFDRTTPTEIVLWDWHYDKGRIGITDSKGKELEFKITQGDNGYWNHKYFKLAVLATVPAFGYCTIILTEKSKTVLPLLKHANYAVAYPYDDTDFVMENEFVKATFSRRTLQLISFIDKQSGEDVVDHNQPAATLRLIKEDPVHGMTAWRVGPYMSITNINESSNVKTLDINLHGIRKWLKYEMRFASSTATVTVSLDKNSRSLKFAFKVDWQEIGRRGDSVPQLNFACPLPFEAKKYRFDIAFSVIDRDEVNQDIPGLSYAAALPTTPSKTLMVVTDTKYAYRTANNCIAVDLIRSSFDPDPYPEFGVHYFTIALAIPENTCAKTLKEIRDEVVQIVPFISGTKHGGSLPLDGKLFDISGDILISAIKTAEDSADGSDLILRLYDAIGDGAKVKITPSFTAKTAEIVDINENTISTLSVKNNIIDLSVPPHQVLTLKITKAN